MGRGCQQNQDQGRAEGARWNNEWFHESMLMCGMHALAAEFTTGASAEGLLDAHPSQYLQ
jgi:hypothetical protein